MIKKLVLKKTLSLVDGQLVATRMQAIQVAANLRDPEPAQHGMMSSGYPGRPGKTAEQVVKDAEKIMAFVTAR